MRRLLLKTVELIPDRARRWVKAHPVLSRPVARLLRMAVPSDRPVILTIQNGPNRGLRLAVDRATPRYYWLQGHDEPVVIETLQEATKPGMVVADIGAHVGIETLMLSRWVGPTGSVLSIEADEATFGRLRLNCDVNGLTNVELIHRAVSDHNGTLRFAASAEVTSHVLADGEVGGAEQTVVCSRLDDLIFTTGGGRLDVVKVDVEGHEGAVLRGASRVLAELRPVFLIEIHHPEALAECVTLLREAGYSMKPVPPNPYYDRVIGDGAGSVPPAAGFERSHLVGSPRRQG
jgi:FkbM family methyltransferase